jgi:hypothetical protein
VQKGRQTRGLREPGVQSRIAAQAFGNGQNPERVVDLEAIGEGVVSVRDVASAKALKRSATWSTSGSFICRWTSF